MRIDSTNQVDEDEADQGGRITFEQGVGDNSNENDDEIRGGVELVELGDQRVNEERNEDREDEHEDDNEGEKEKDDNDKVGDSLAGSVLSSGLDENSTVSDFGHDSIGEGDDSASQLTLSTEEGRDEKQFDVNRDGILRRDKDGGVV